MAQTDTRSVIIIGSGPAGYTAAIYAARANLSPLVLAGSQMGGQLMITTDVENYPGFPDGVQGPELMALFQQQAERFGAEIVPVDVTKVDFSSHPFKVWTDEEEYSALSVIIATGASAKFLGVPGESEFMGRGVSACATCDGFFFRDKKVVVVGGGDVAMEEALFLTRYASSVTVIHRRDQLRASKIMQERAKSNPKIDFIWNTVVEEILGDQNVKAVKVRNVVTGELREIPVDGVFVAIGHKPNTDIFVGQVELDEKGYIKAQDSWSTATNVDGVFAAGDVRDHKYRQAVTAAGDGCKAAMDAERWLESQGVQVDISDEIYSLPK